MPSPPSTMMSAEPASATARCEPAHRSRDTAVASSTSARPSVSSPRRRSTDDTANPPVMSAIISSDVLKNESVRRSGGLGEEVLHRVVVADEVADVVAHRAVGDAGEQQPRRPAQHRAALQPHRQPDRPHQPRRGGGRAGSGWHERAAEVADGEQGVRHRHEGERRRDEQQERPGPLAGERPGVHAPTPSATATTACRCRCRRRRARRRRRRGPPRRCRARCGCARSPGPSPR